LSKVIVRVLASRFVTNIHSVHHGSCSPLCVSYLHEKAQKER